MAEAVGKVNLVRGEDRTIPVCFRKKSGAPLDLTGLTAAVATFFGKSSESTKTLTLAGNTIQVVSPAGAGCVNLIMNAAFTNDLKDGDLQDFQISLTISSKVTIFKFHESLNVEESL